MKKMKHSLRRYWPRESKLIAGFLHVAQNVKRAVPYQTYQPPGG